MGNSINDGAGAPICSGDLDIAVQVTGLSHTSDTQHQKIKLQHYSGEQATSALLEPTSNEEINQQTIVPSTIFKWDDKAKTPSGNSTKLILEVASEKGAPIQIPIVDEFYPNGSTPNDYEYYLTNRLRAIEPFTYILTDIDKKKYFAPSRVGYLYIFKAGKLWRELFIGRDETTGANHYQDVNLANYRQKNTDGSYTYTKGEREVTGKPLQDIWIPDTFYFSETALVKIAFSDVPLSAERISYLESNQNVLSLRANTINWQKGSEDIFDSIEQGPHDHGGARPIKKLHACRGRDETIEFLLDNRHLFFTANNHLQNALNNANNFKQAMRGKSKVLDQSKPIDPVQETSAWHYQLLKSKAERTQDEEQTFQQLASLWEDLPTFSDVWQQPSQRGIWGVQVNDPNYHLTYAKFRIQQLVQLQQQLAKDAETQEYYTVASFIEKQRLLIELFQEGLDDDVSATGLDKYRAAINLKEREMVSAILKFDQRIINHYLRLEETPEFFADMLSNEDNETDCIGHYNHLSELLLYATLPESQYDPLAPINIDLQLEEKDLKGSAIEYVNTIFTDKTNRYHQMLWPDVAPEELDAPYVAAAEQPNIGDGIFNPYTWERMVRENVLETKAPATLNGVIALNVYEQAKHLPLVDKSNMLYFKTTVSTVFTIINKIKDATEHARKMLLQTSKDGRAASAALMNAYSELNQKRYELNQASTSESAAKKQLQAYLDKVTNAEAALRRIQDAADAKLMSAGIIKARIPVKDLQLLRIVSGGKLNNLQFTVATSMPVNGRIGNFCVIGMDANATSRSTEVKRKFELFDNDTLVSDNATKGRRTDVHLLVLPKDDLYLQLRQRQLDVDIPDLQNTIANNKAAAQLTTGQLQSLTQARQVAQTAHTTAKVTHSRALDEKVRQATLYSKKMDVALRYRRVQAVMARIQNTGVAPPILLGLELINLKFVSDNFEQLKRTRGSVRARFGKGAAYGDVIMAAAIVAEQLEAKLYSIANKPIPKVSLHRVLNANSKILIALRLPNVAAKLVPMGGLAIIGIGLSLADTIDSIIRGDSSGFGNAVLVLAGVAGLFGMFASSSSPILGFGPLGWAIWGVCLLVVGVGLLLFFSDSDLEQWFKQGPFGGHNQYPQLKDESTAFAALLNLMTQPQIEIERNPYQAEARQIMATFIPGSEEYNFVKKIASANMCISVTSGLLDFTSYDTVLNCEARLYLCHEEGNCAVMDAGWTYSYKYIEQPDAQILHIEPSAQGMVLFVYSPQNTPKTSERHWGSQFSSRKDYYWILAVKGQNDLGNEKKIHHFPSPSFKDKLPYNVEQHGIPTFAIPSYNNSPIDADDLKQPYWFKHIASTKVFNP